jgi:hypothetical protein
MNCLFELLYRRWQRLIMMTRDTHGWGAAMTQSEADVQELIDRQRIWECLQVLAFHRAEEILTASTRARCA